MFSASPHLFTSSLPKFLGTLSPWLELSLSPRLSCGMGGGHGGAGCLPEKSIPATSRIIFLLTIHPVTRGTDNKCICAAEELKEEGR